jgi:hypothetical protein
MLSLLLLLVTVQVPAVPGESTLVSFCKQGRLSACQQLRHENPKLADALEEQAKKAALRLAALRAAEEEAREQEEAKTAEAEGGAAPEPPDCQGQTHHVISRPIAKVLKDHETLAGLYKPRDERFRAKAKDKESHCGYQQWHRDVDAEVIRWLDRERKATPEQFEKFLRDIYNRPAMRQRFPNGF